jgi:hypothetical protein
MFIFDAIMVALGLISMAQTPLPHKVKEPTVVVTTLAQIEQEEALKWWGPQ